ncbi:hypothetical protein BKA65DRAFT_478896 [Rhexocercosporidium sp. MPI-PUGE-AT-0058]|nr:hypothetical protein BKA65DRAFT_478896 [Rhexocercosporidium sp. MPI-PUGE-AT-0058]
MRVSIACILNIAQMDYHQRSTATVQHKDRQHIKRVAVRLCEKGKARKIYNYDLQEMKEFECDQPTISHHPAIEDCHDCFIEEEKDMLVGELEMESRNLGAKMMTLPLTSSHAVSTNCPSSSFKELAIMKEETAKSQSLRRAYHLRLQGLGERFKQHQVQLELAVRKGDQEAIERCKAFMDECAIEFRETLDEEIEAAKMDFIQRCEEKMRELELQFSSLREHLLRL